MSKRKDEVIKLHENLGELLKTWRTHDEDWCEKFSNLCFELGLYGREIALNRK